MRKSGKHVNNSPFKIMVGPSEIGEASRVKAFGKGLVEAHTFEVAEFFVDTRNAGMFLVFFFLLLHDLSMHYFKFKSSVMHLIELIVLIQRIWRTWIVHRGSK